MLSTLPDMFVFAESLQYKSVKPIIPNYSVISHSAKKGSCRRGMALFFAEKLRYNLTKDHASSKFDIIWLRYKDKIQEMIFCFFYAPGANHSDEEITAF